jgi:hypothetical protein
MDQSLEAQIKAAQDNHGEANYQEETDGDQSLYERVLMESGDSYERGLAVIGGMPDHIKATYMDTEARRFLLEKVLEGVVAIGDALDIFEYEAAAEMEFDLDYMIYLVEAMESFKVRMTNKSDEPGETFITEYAAYLEERGMFVERTEFLKQHGKYNPLNES